MGFVGFDFRDLADLVPFIRDNLSETVYLIVFSLVCGFALGKLIGSLTSRVVTKSKKKLIDENKRLQDEIEELKQRQLTSSHIVPIVALAGQFSCGQITEIEALVSVKLNDNFPTSK